MVPESKSKGRASFHHPTIQRRSSRGSQEQCLLRARKPDGSTERPTARDRSGGDVDLVRSRLTSKIILGHLSV
jgi:hypothetical protein